MNTDLHEYFLEPRKIQKARKGNATSWYAECSVMSSELGNHSSFSTHTSSLDTGVSALIIHSLSLGEAAKEVQR